MSSSQGSKPPLTDPAGADTGSRRSRGYRRVLAPLTPVLLLVGLGVAAEPALAATTAAHPQPSVVKVAGHRGAWRLSVDGRRWIVKGVTYGLPQGRIGTNIADLSALGVNTLRTWGVDDTGTRTLLRSAAKHRMKVVVGHWLNQGVAYATDTAYRAQARADVLRRVRALKNEPGVLMWDVGNEVLLTMGGRSKAAVRANQVAYARFVDSLAVAIHRIDPNHPVTSTDATTDAWATYARYAPHLDLLAVNMYRGIGDVHRKWVAGHYTKPYIVTEYGPSGDWEVPADANGIPREPSDRAKRDAYTAAWAAIRAHPGVALGGTAFNYGTETDYAGVWLNIRTGGRRRLAWYALQHAYTGRKPANTPPVITAMTVPAGPVAAGSRITLAVTARDADRDRITYSVRFGAHALDGSGALTAAASTTAGGRVSVTAPTRPGVWKVVVLTSDHHGNVGIETRSIRVTGSG